MSKMFNILYRIRNEFGIFTGSLYVFSRVCERLTRGRVRLVRYFIVAQPVPSSVQPVCRPSKVDVVVPAGPEDAHRFTCPRPPEVIVQRFARHHRCLMALSKDRFAGFLWIANGHYEEDEVRCRFVLQDPRLCVWDYDVTVEPDFRMGRTFARLWDRANELLVQEGVRWSLSRISAFNPQSIASHGRMGTVRLHTLTFLCLGRLQLSLLDCKPFIHLGWSARRVPVLSLRPPELT